MNSHCMCRVCETVHDLKNLFDEENEELLHMLRCIANISVKKDDLLPKEICNYCAYRLQMAYDFKIQCEITDQTLRRMFENVEVKFATLQDLSDNNVSKQVPKKLFIDPTACDFIKEEEPEPIDDHILNTVSNLDQNIAKEEYISNSELIGVLDSEINNRIDEERDLGHIENADVELIEENYCNELHFMQPSKDAESSGSGNGDDPDAELLEEDDIIERLEEEFMDQLNDMENSKDGVSLLVDSSMSQEQDAVQPVGADMVELVAASETDSNHVSSTSEVKSTNLARRQNNKTFICPWCSATFTVYTEFNAHKKTHGRPRFQCTICGKTCARRSGLKDHIATHSGANKIQCHLCSKQCSNRGNLYRHINQCHEKIKPHSCEVCGACFSRKSGVREHALTHSEIRNFSCDICDKKFKTLVYLNTHKRTHMPVEERRKLPRAKPPKRQLYVCEHCGKKSYTLATHITHKKIHSDVKRFVCELCQKGFHFKNTLLTHMLCHTGEKPYTCDICGKGFRQIAHLNTHKLAVHEQARRHKCQYCGKAFTSSGTLKVHERIHTGEKPYECELCESRYIDANGLRKHRQKIHADVYQQPTKTAYPIKLVGEDTMHATVFDEESLVAICENEIGELSMDQGVVDQLNVYLDEMHQGYTEVIESET